MWWLTAIHLRYCWPRPSLGTIGGSRDWWRGWTVHQSVFLGAGVGLRSTGDIALLLGWVLQAGGVRFSLSILIALLILRLVLGLVIIYLTLFCSTFGWSWLSWDYRVVIDWREGS